MSNRVILGLSGGVDSSVAAFLLKQQGFTVEAVFMKNWEEDDASDFCPAEADFEDAKTVCEQLEIPLHLVNFSKEYWQQVFEPCLSEFELGRTPNPDILCNQHIKFNAFFNYAQTLKADFIATGHYAEVKKQVTFELHKAQDLSKDQSYFLYAIAQEALSKTLFPLGHLQKTQVRSIAEKAGLSTSQKPDSTGICFIGERKFKPFLSQYLSAQHGSIETLEGALIGTHEGLAFYTLGQRQGLNIGGVRGASEKPWYVIKKDFDQNKLIVAQGEDHPLLYTKTLKANQCHWVSVPPTFPLNCHAKIRYRQSDVSCQVISIGEDTLEVTFDKPQRAVTPGQSVVFYRNTQCLGGGVIL